MFSYERTDVVSVGTQTIVKFPYIYEGDLPSGYDPVKVSFDYQRYYFCPIVQDTIIFEYCLYIYFHMSMNVGLKAGKVGKGLKRCNKTTLVSVTL